MIPLFTNSNQSVLGRQLKKLSSLALLLGGLHSAALAQTSVFPRSATFTGTSTSNFTLGGNAQLTSGTAIDPTGPGVLRLTSNAGDQAGFAVDNTTFATPNGFSISFEFFSYGSTSTAPADGFNVFLVDGAGTDPTIAGQFSIGASGGSLGYAQKTIAPIRNGVSKGYLGIGIDEFGNYSNPTEGRIGGPGVVVNAVAVRGPYDPTDGSKGYAYVAGSPGLGFNLANGGPTRVTDPANAGYRKAFVNLVPVTTSTGTIYKISVRIQNGQNLVTAIDNVTVTNPPATLRVGFAASTGGSNSIHEIRGLEIVQAPIANADQTGTRYNVPVTINVLANDQIANGAPAIAPATIDLNPNTVALDNSFTVANTGTFTVNSSGVVTFTPVATFSGTVSIPYTVNNVNGNTSNTAPITVVVTGADVATVVSGPTTVNPGSTVSYSVTTTDNGQETATNVTPTLTLPVGVTYVSGGSYNSTTRVVTFPASTLTAGQSVTNSVVVTMPGTTGGVSLVSNYTYPTGAVVPDAVTANNSSTLAVNVTGSANIAGVCAIPGKDGVGNLTSSDQPNTYYPGTGTVAVNSTAITVGAATGNTTSLVAGDLLLVMQMQGATMVTTNDVNYGTVSNVTAGRYEYAIVKSVAGSVITLTDGLANAYTTNTATNQAFQVIRIPQYSSLTLTGAVTGLAWNGTTGGVLALDVAGTTTFSNGASLTMTGKGFRGGVGRQSTSTTGINTAFVVASTANTHGAKAEGLAGAIGTYAQGKAANGGGGGNHGDNKGSLDLTDNAGGGGGGNGGAGGTGVGSNGANGANGGIAGIAAPAQTVNSWYLGGGGGAGSSNSANASTESSGGNGGGIVVLRANAISGTGIVAANGSAGQSTGTANVGGGGGGAGGTVILTATSGLNNLTVQAAGGNGGSTTRSGGSGGGGIIYTSAATAAGSSVAGAAAGTNTANATVGGTTAVACAPAIITALRTTTPQVIPSASMKATYVFTVSNTGGGYSGLSVTPDLATNASTSLITYASTSKAVVLLADGTIQTLVAGTDYTVSGVGTDVPVFTLAGSRVVPAGASVEFTFEANISAVAVRGTPYQSNAATRYLDPQRTAATGTTATAGYTSANASAPDVVTITAPLPVQLTRFVATAVGANVLLNWATAQELNNHHFVVERSLDGQSFQQLAVLSGKGTTSRSSDYQYVDEGAAKLNTVLYYRLQQVDTDGKSTASPVQVVAFRRAATDAVTLFPNPTTGRVQLHLGSLPAGTYTVQVLEATGRVLQQHSYEAGPQELHVDSLPTGTYFVKIQGVGVNAVLPLIRQ